AAVAVVGIASDDAVLVVEELDGVQPGQRVQRDARPLQPAVGRREDDRATAAARQFLAADRPAGEGVQERESPQRAADAGVLPLPGLAAIDRVPDDALVADGPAFVAVDELNRPQRGIVEMARRGGNGQGGRGENDDRGQKATHWNVPAKPKAAVSRTARSGGCT